MGKKKQEAARVAYAEALHESIAMAMKAEGVYSNRHLSNAGRDGAIARARAAVQNTGDTSTVSESGLLELLERSANGRLAIEIAKPRPTTEALRTMDGEGFQRQLAETLSRGKLPRRASPFLTAAGVTRSSSTPAAPSPRAAELAEMDAPTFATHYAAKIAGTRGVSGVR